MTSVHRSLPLGADRWNTDRMVVRLAPFVRRLVSLGVLVPLATAACVITSADDDGSASTGTDADTSPTGFPSSATSTGMPTTGPSTTANTTSDSTTEGTTGIPGDCGDNVLADSGFEGGTPNPSWEESSTIFDSPICDLGCTEDPGAGPRTGDWWVWFGGLEEPDTASVSQEVTIEPDAAYLSLYLEINAAQGEIGDDLIVAEIDGNEVFMATDAEIEDYATYREVVVDISAYADGGQHTLEIRAEVTGDGLTNFFVEDVTIVSCDEGGGSSGSSGSTGSGTDGTGSTGSTSGMGSTGSTGSTGTAGT